MIISSSKQNDGSGSSKRTKSEASNISVDIDLADFAIKLTIEAPIGFKNAAPGEEMPLPIAFELP